MDESGPRLVHGWVERFADLAAVSYRNWNLRVDLRWIQGARIGRLSRHFFGNRGIRYERIEIQCRPSPAKTRPECPDGAITKSPAKVSNAF